LGSPAWASGFPSLPWSTSRASSRLERRAPCKRQAWAVGGSGSSGYREETAAALCRARARPGQRRGPAEPRV
jgi:hypothetical protein